VLLGLLALFDGHFPAERGRGGYGKEEREGTGRIGKGTEKMERV